jgi:DNA anti-recombination protein RmuC
MFASFVAAFTAAFSSLPEITQAFIVIIALMTVLMVGPFYNNRTLAYGPTILTMVGIFGCFLGISLGLMEFKTSDIQGSVPSLVDGIKTAFWASVSGVGGALLIKIRLLVFGPPRVATDGTVAEATVDDLAMLLQSLHQSLAGKEDSTLLSQTKLMRQESRDGLHSLKTSLDSYMEKIAESNSKALIEALKEVIKDFNAKINEQFGENFKQLNSAVEKILIWQESYRQQMAEMINQQTVTTKNMSESTARYAEMVGHSETFSFAANNLTSLIKTLDLQRDQISSSIATLGTLLKSAGDNLPKIESHVVEMTKQVEQGVRASNEQISNTVTAMTQNLQTAHSEMKRLLIESAEKANTEVSTRSKQLNEQVSSTVATVTQNLQTSHTEMKRLLVEASEATNKDVNAHIKQLSENTQKQVVALDKALSDELTKSIQTLGEHLTALSRRFVEDYTPLTERLKTLVQTAGRVQ